MNINTAAILSLREGLTGCALAEHKLRAIAITVHLQYANADARDRLAFEVGMLRNTVRELSELLAVVVEDPDERHEAEAA